MIFLKAFFAINILYAYPRLEIKWPKDLNKEIKNKLENHFTLKKNIQKWSNTSITIIQTIKKDIKSFKRILESLGFLERIVEYKTTASIDKFKINLIIIPGPRYNIKNIYGPKDFISFYKNLKGKPLNAEHIIKIQKNIIESAKESGYPFAKQKLPQIKIDEDCKVVDLYLGIQLRSFFVIKTTKISKLKNLSEQYIKNRIEWKDGESYDIRKINSTEKELINSKIFSTISIVPDKKNIGTILVKLTEMPPRTFGARLEYDTSRGPGGGVYWKHYNLHGKGDQLGIRAKGRLGNKKLILSKTELNYNEYLFAVDYLFSDFLSPKQSFYTSGKLLNTKRIPYEAKDSEIAFEVKTLFSKKISVDYQIKGNFGRSEKDNNKYLYSMLSPSLNSKFDSRNNELNPMTGNLFVVSITPQFYTKLKNNKQKIDTKKDFLFEISLSDYATFFETRESEESLVFASFVKYKEIFNNKLRNIPQNQRLFAGGEGSVRGYAFQTLGTIIPNTQKKPSYIGYPIGGNRLLEFGGEFRFRFDSEWGFSVFTETGRLFSSGYDKNLKGAFKTSRKNDNKKNDNNCHFLSDVGIGIEYYSKIAPIRIAIAFPLKRRIVRDKNFDAPFQLYFGIGQSF